MYLQLLVKVYWARLKMFTSVKTFTSFHCMFKVIPCLARKVRK